MQNFWSNFQWSPGRRVVVCCTALVCLLLLGSAVDAQENAQESAKPTVSFLKDIRPILSDKCFHCHGPDEHTRAVDLRFDQQDSAMEAIEPGSSEDSEMISRILEEDADLKMPPAEAHKPLKPEEIELLKAWIDQGANWDKFWAYVPPKKHAVEEPQDGDWSNNWIDQMVLARLEAKQLEPAASADRVTLIRRLYFDLIGLPPTPQQVDSFLNDQSPDAYSELVDSLLGSKHFGERLAMYWLDLVRFADTVGYHGDQVHNVAPYRDWVINSFNDNMPFDQFTREQLAGDLLPDSTVQQKVASGYNRLLQTTHEGGLQPKEYRAIYAADRVRNVSVVWMGATVGCAQCHDHKYDPYTAKDFYALSAFFADLDDEQHFKNGTNELPTRRGPELLVIGDKDRLELEAAKKLASAAKKELGRLKAEKAGLEKEKQAADKAEAESQDTVADKDSSSTDGSCNVESLPVEDPIADVQKEIVVADKAYKQRESEVKKIESRGMWTMIAQPLAKPRTVRVLPRGNWLDESGPEVGPAVPEFLGEVETEAKRPSRLDLANWLTDSGSDSGKLTARVMSNRIWYLLMGVGVSKSLDDFGGQGEAPAFPELLDNLAIDFAKDWDIKRAMRQIVMSKTYQQSSTASEELQKLDPYNQLFARQSRYRLPAEVIRDVALAASGLLNVEKVGGRSVKPYQPEGYYRHLNFPTRKYKHSVDATQWRRGVYVHWQRMFLHPSMKALDAPSREEGTCQRTRSNTPLAALAMLNDPSFVEAARVLAQKIIVESTNESTDTTFESRLNLAYLWSVGRKPEQNEVEILSRLYKTSLKEFKADKKARDSLLAIGQSPVNESVDAATLAAWTNVTRAILNLSETTTRN